MDTGDFSNPTDRISPEDFFPFRDSKTPIFSRSKEYAIVKYNVYRNNKLVHSEAKFNLYIYLNGRLFT